MKTRTHGNMRVLDAMPEWCIDTMVDGKHAGQVRARTIGNGKEFYDVLLADRRVETNVSPDRLSPRPPTPADFLLH